MKKFTKFILISFFFLFSLFDLKAAQEIKIVHLKRMVEREPTIYSINPEIINNGILGSRMGIKDNNTTGKFTNQKFELIENFSYLKLFLFFLFYHPSCQMVL